MRSSHVLFSLSLLMLVMGATFALRLGGHIASESGAVFSLIVGGMFVGIVAAIRYACE